MRLGKMTPRRSRRAGHVEADRLVCAANRLTETVVNHLRAYEFDRALDAIWSLIADANRYVSEEQPWALARAAAAETAGLLRV
jgi:methionyl-tRNA synthetase